MSSCGESFRKGQWSLEEDECLKASVALLGESRWDAIAKATGLKRSGKSCRLRWLNYLQPNLKHSPISVEEEQIILRLHQKWGNKWARIARSLPGRTDNEIKNYWRGCLRKKKTTQSIDQSSSKAKTLQRTCVCSSWNSDADERDYNDVIKEISLQEDKSKEASPCSGALTTTDFDELPKLLVMNPESPYQNHFSNWVSLFPGENVDQFMSSYFQRDIDAAGWSWEETSDCWDMNLFTSTEL